MSTSALNPALVGTLLSAPLLAIVLARAAVIWRSVDRRSRRTLVTRCAILLVATIPAAITLGWAVITADGALALPAGGAALVITLAGLALAWPLLHGRRENDDRKKDTTGHD